MNCLYSLRMPSLLEFFKKLKCYNSSITRVRSITFQPACFKRLSMISFLVSFSFFTFIYTVIYSWSKYAKFPFLCPKLNILNRLIICEFNADRRIMDQGTSRVETDDENLGRSLFSLFAGWFPASATISPPYTYHLPPSSHRASDFPAHGFPTVFFLSFHRLSDRYIFCRVY